VQFSDVLKTLFQGRSNLSDKTSRQVWSPVLLLCLNLRLKGHSCGSMLLVSNLQCLFPHCILPETVPYTKLEKTRV